MTSRVLFLGADHAGFDLKEKLKDLLEKAGHDVRDLSPAYIPEDDYPIPATRVAQAVKKTKGARGIIMCGSGNGVTMAANRVKGVRAFDAHSAEETKLAREHNDANVIALAGWKLSPNRAMELVNIFLATPASRAERHRRRVEMLG